MAEAFLSASLTRSSRAALAKIRARGEHLRLVYEAELADHLRFLGETQAVIARIWKGKIVRLEFLARREALVDVQRAWKRAVVRRGLQREIDARVLVSPSIPPTPPARSAPLAHTLDDTRYGSRAIVTKRKPRPLNEVLAPFSTAVWINTPTSLHVGASPLAEVDVGQGP